LRFRMVLSFHECATEPPSNALGNPTIPRVDTLAVDSIDRNAPSEQSVTR
jgi:hypothetical protein